MNAKATVDRKLLGKIEIRDMRVQIPSIAATNMTKGLPDSVLTAASDGSSDPGDMGASIALYCSPRS